MTARRAELRVGEPLRDRGDPFWAAVSTDVLALR